MFTDSDLRWLKELHIQEEGYRTRVYLDTEGHPTIGIGFNLDRADARTAITSMGFDYVAVKGGTVNLTYRAVDTLYSQDIQTAIENTKRLFPNLQAMPWRKALILVDMMFQLGPSKFSGFAKMIEAVRGGNWSLAAQEMMDSKMAKQCRYRCLRRKDILEEP